ncbi:hypothetical protein ACHQM5_003423 [Ranunculus cassubicifolius]
MKMSSRSQSYKSEPQRQKNRLTEDQLRLLEASFTQNKKLEPECKFQLAYQLGMPAKQVAIWYQNRRARWKTQKVELDYRTIQRRLDSSLEIKWRLQNEVGRLRSELQRAQQMLFTLNYNAPLHDSSSLSSSCEENGSNGSSMVADVNCNPQNVSDSWQKTESWQSAESWESTESWQSTESWEIEDEYDYLLGAGEQTSTVSKNGNFFNP